MKKVKISILRMFLLSGLFCAFLLADNVSAQHKSVVSHLPPISSSSWQRTKSNSDFLVRLMMTDPFLRTYIDRASEYEIQIIYTQIHRDSLRNPSFTQYSYRLNSKEYFNPASLVKWPLILLGLEKINNLQKDIPDISIYNKIDFEGALSCLPWTGKDNLSQDRVPRLANYIKEMILVSDDNAYNRMYDFLGQAYINKRLQEMGYDSLRVMSRFASCGIEENRSTPAACFYDNSGKLIYRQSEAYNPEPLFNPLGNVLKGKAHQNAEGKLINEPKNYSRFNNMSLQDINDLMFFTFFHEQAPADKKFNLSDDDYGLLYKYTAMYPAESEFPAFQTNKRKYPTHLKKYLYYGKNSAITNVPGLRIHNMVGESHGTLSDIAYFVNPLTGVEFMLSAVINTCFEGVIASSHYHYTDKGQPFLAHLGKLIYNYESDGRQIPDLK